MAQLKAGSRLKSTVCDTQVMVICLLTFRSTNPAHQHNQKNPRYQSHEQVTKQQQLKKGHDPGRQNFHDRGRQKKSVRWTHAVATRGLHSPPDELK